MIKSLLAALASGVLLLGMLSNAMAVPISYEYEDVYQPGTDYLLDKNGGPASVSWTFDISDDADWNKPLGQVFTGGWITLVLEDDGGPGDGEEKASFTFDAGTESVIDKNLNAFRGVKFNLITTPLDDGLIWATLTATRGDFYFRSATLHVQSEYEAIINPDPDPDPNSDPVPVPTPEPSTMVLLGSGLLGLIYVGRSRRRK